MIKKIYVSLIGKQY